MAGGSRLVRPIDPQPFQNTVDDWENRQLRSFQPTGGNAPASGRGPSGYDALGYTLYSPPDQQGHIVSPRRRLFNLQNAVALPVGLTTVNNTIILPDTLQPDDGILVEYLGATAAVVLGGGATVTIRDVQITLRDNGNRDLLPLGTPSITTLTPTNADSFQFSAQTLFAARDLDFFDRLNGGTGILQGANQPLQLVFLVTYQDAVAASTVSQRFYAMYRYVQGLTGA